jgi:hypothetical protein
VSPLARFGLPLFIALLALQGCDDLSEFRGAFDGEIIQGGFVRECFAAGTRATLVFDPERAVFNPADLNPEHFNHLSTSDGTFDNTPLEPIAALPHDQLSQLDFPGPRRLRNFLLLARPDKGPLKGRDATVVVSLLADERVEVRVIARTEPTLEVCAGNRAGVSDAGTGDAGQNEAPPSSEPRVNEYFGIFRLKS